MLRVRLITDRNKNSSELGKHMVASPQEVRSPGDRDIRSTEGEHHATQSGRLLSKRNNTDQNHTLPNTD